MKTIKRFSTSLVKIMKKKVLIVILSLSIVSSILISIIRWRVEADNRWVEMACDYSELSRLCIQRGYELDAFLLELKEGGINSIAIEEETLERLSSEGRLTLIKGEEVKRFQYLAPVQSILLKDLVTKDIEKYTFAITSDFGLGEKVERILVEKLGKKKVKRIEENSYGRPLMVLALFGIDETEISQLGIGFSTEKMERVANYGLKAILLLTNGPFNSEASIQALFSTVTDWRDISAVIFSGDSVLGYPGSLDSLRRQLEKAEAKLGIVEFLNQDGLAEVTKNLYQKIVRVHSISPEEVAAIKEADGLDVSRLIARFQRAVKERNVRLLHIHLPFISGSNENLQIESNLDYIREIKTAVLESNFKIGFSQPFKPLPASLDLLRLPIFLVVLIVPLWLISFYRSLSLGVYPVRKPFPLPGEGKNKSSLARKEFNVSFELSNRVYYFYLFTLLALILFFWQDRLFIQIVTLIAALSFPLLALTFGLPLPESESSVLKARKEGNLSRAIWLFLKVTITTIFGGLLIACLLTRLDFMLKVHQFRGVKASFILPLIMGLFLMSGWSEQSLKKGGLIRFYIGRVSKFLSRKAEFRHLLIFSILALGGIVLLLRSGNYSGPFLWEIENRARQILEKLLIVRPRIKEFFIGHPLMILGIYLYLNGKAGKEENLRLKAKSWQSFIILGLIGQVSIINSFCHAHTPLVISLGRTINGIWLGTIVGVLLVAIVRRRTSETLRN